MSEYLIELLGISLGFTLLFELIPAFFFGLGNRRAIYIIVLVNILTNPAAVWLHWCWGLPQMPLEVAVVAIESLIYRNFPKEFSHPVAYALTANGISWGLGLLIQLL